MSKDLTTSRIDRQNILNNNYAIDEIKNQLEYNVSFPMKYLSSETVIAGAFYDKIYSSK